MTDEEFEAERLTMLVRIKRLANDAQLIQGQLDIALQENDALEADQLALIHALRHRLPPPSSRTDAEVVAFARDQLNGHLVVQQRLAQSA